jgi:hypothetical protein
MQRVQMTLRLQAVGTFSKDSPRQGIGAPYHNEKLKAGDLLTFEVDSRPVTTGMPFLPALF